MVQMWFRTGGILAGGDLAPPVVPGTDYRAHWNQFDTGAGSPSFQIVSLPYFEGLRLFARLGWSEAAFQRLWLTVLAAGAALAVVYLAHAVVRSPLALAVAGFLATFNAYRLTTTFDGLPLAAIVSAGVLGGLVIRAGGGSRRARPLLFAIASVSCAYVFLNPPHLALVFAWVAVAVVVAIALYGRSAARRIARFLAAALPLALLLNVWWIVPAALTIANPTFHARFAAAGVEQWAWTHARAGLGNVVALTSSWAWGRAEYFPFSVQLQRFPFAELAYVPAAAAALGLVLTRGRQRNVALVLLACAAVVVWVMKGLHPPLSGTNRWLYEHVPGFWLLREPTKAALLLVLVYALLAALAVERLRTLSRPLAFGVAAALVSGTAAYAHALLSGAVVPSHRPLLPSAHVRMPKGWEDVARYVDTAARPGKVVVLPRLDYYQAETEWGYYGTTFLHQLIHRPVIDAPLPGGYYRDPIVPELITRLETRIVMRSGGVRTLLQALGARYILLRRDLVTNAGRSFISPRLLARRLRDNRDVRLIRSFGIADLYGAERMRNAEVYPAIPVVEDAAANTPRVHSAVDVGAEAVVVRPDARDLLRGVPQGEVGTLALARRTPQEVAEELARADVLHPATRRSAGSGVSLRAGWSSLVLPHTRLDPRRRLPALADARAGPFFEQRRVPLTPELARRVGDCHKSDGRTLREAGITAHVEGSGPGAIMRLGSRDHSACVTIDLGDRRPPSSLRLRISYRSVRGNPARVCVWQEGSDRCARSRPLRASRGWQHLTSIVPVAPSTRSLHLFLYADGGGRTTITEYRSITLAPSRPTVGVAVMPIVRLPAVSYRRVSPSEIRVHVARARTPFLLVAAETYAGGWRLAVDGKGSKGVTHVRVNGYANGWRIPWPGSYDLTIEYKPERLARLARRLDLVLVPLAVVALFWRPERRLLQLRRPRRERGS
jgi:hypothetical protein